MSAYLARLKQLDDAINHHDAPATVPPKPPEPPFAGFDGTDTGYIEKIILDKEVLLEAVKNGAAAWMWDVMLPDGSLIVTTSPASTMAEMKAAYPDAIKIEVIEA